MGFFAPPISGTIARPFLKRESAGSLAAGSSFLGIRRARSWAAAQTDASMDDAVRFTCVNGNSAAMKRGEMFLHLVTHGSYHRGWVAEMFFEFLAKLSRGKLEFPKVKPNTDLISLVNLIRRHQTEQLTPKELHAVVNYAGLYRDDPEASESGSIWRRTRAESRLQKVCLDGQS